MKKRFNKNTFSCGGTRSVVLFFIMMIGFVICCVNLFVINIDNQAEVVDMNTSKSLVLGESRGIIYDCKLKRLVAADYDYVCAVKPDVNSAEVLRNVLDADAYVNVVNQISKGNPVKFVSPYFVSHDDIVCEKIYKRYNNSQLASHLIGYVDYKNNGVTGIEKVLDDSLNKYSGRYQVRYFVDGRGDVLNGGDVEILSEGYNSNGGIVLTIDSEIQSELEKAMDSSAIDKGAAVMLDVESGAVKAMVSRPDFNPSNVEEYLEDDKLSLFNRAVAAYPVGSVFKPLIAASALEQGVNPAENYDCKGYISDNGFSFRCTKAHGVVNMATAIMYSCNCYFINLINSIDYAQTVELASALGFGRELEICNGFYCSSGNLPSSDKLDSFAARANFSFGQGSLSATVLQVACLYAAVANGGEFYAPYVLEGECNEDGAFTPTHELSAPYKVINKSTADTIAACLELAVREGTGKNAQTDNFDVAGKTATAQTGDFVEGKERLVTWFAGFFPYDSPKYVLVIMCEDGESGSVDCAPIFSKVSTMFNFDDK